MSNKKSKDKVYNFFENRPILWILLTVSPSSISIISALAIAFINYYFNPKSNIHNFVIAFIAFVIFTISLILSILYNLGKTKYDDKISSFKDNIRGLENSIAIKQDVIESYKYLFRIQKDISGNKLETLHSYINNVSNYKNSINVISDPLKQIEFIKHRITQIVEYKMKDMKGVKIISNIIYKFDDNKEWISCGTFEKSSDIKSPTELVNNNTSTYCRLLEGTINIEKNDEIVQKGLNDFLLINNKKEAYKLHNYKSDNFDIEYKYKGSIFCYKIILDDPKTNNNIIHILVSVSTYGQKFVSDDNEEKINDQAQYYCEYIKENFETALKIEFLFEYMRELKNKKNSNNQIPQIENTSLIS